MKQNGLQHIYISEDLSLKVPDVFEAEIAPKCQKLPELG